MHFSPSCRCCRDNVDDVQIGALTVSLKRSDVMPAPKQRTVINNSAVVSFGTPNACETLQASETLCCAIREVE